MKKRLIKDLFLRQFIYKRETFFTLTKILSRLDIIEHMRFIYVLYKIQKNVYFSKIRNRCFITGRNNSINKLTKISRLKFKELTRAGFVLGFSKCSW